MQDKVAVITGGFGTLGRAVVKAFEAVGSRVAVLDRSAVPGAEGLRGTERRLLLGGIDLARFDAAERAMQSVIAQFGGIDVLVNIAGGFRWQTLEQGDLGGWDQMYEVNLKTAVTATKAALSAIIRSPAGRIINIGAGAAAKAGAGMGAYTASKAGVQRLTESLSEELKDRGVTVNAILPGTIDTPQNRADMPSADHSRWVAPEAIADVIVFLASDAARAVTGAALPVFGRG
jgi:NAD(P)-dependent dehydrogenase (short-subunit alcohol dehydrogenase family)